MSARRSLAVRLPLTVFRWTARLLPVSFRASYFEEAERDLEDMLLARLRGRGRLAALLAGAVAVLDLLARAPKERWAARSGASLGTARRGGPGAGERVMSVWNEIRLAVRALVRRPGYSAAATLTLAVGVGATAAIFTVVNAVLLRPLPYPEADRIVMVGHHAPGIDLPELASSPGMVRLYRDEGSFFGGMAAFTIGRRNLVGGPQPERIAVTNVTPEIFDVLDVRPAVGRPFNEADARPGASPVAILTHATWVTRFGGDPGVLARTIELDGVSTEIVGVMPPGFAFPDAEPVALTPLTLDPNGPFGAFGPRTVARIPDGASIEDVRARATDLQSRIPDYFGGDPGPDFLVQARWSVSVELLQDDLVGEDVASALWVVLATVGLVLLIACANVANLFLVRADARRREIAVREALGAGRARIAVGFLSEALVLGAAGGALGTMLAWAGVRLLVTRAPVELPRIHEVGVDATTLAFAAGISLASGLVFGSIPLVRPFGASAAGLSDGGRGATEGRERHRARSVLVAGQLALALVLLVAAGLMLRSFHALRSVELGFDPSDVLTVGLSLHGVGGADGARFYQAVADEVAALPGVESVGLTTFVPIGGGGWNAGSLFVESRPREEGALPRVAMYKAVGADYLAAVRQPLVEGRTLTAADWQGGAPVALVNRTFADRFLDGRAVGEGIKWDESAEFARIVGVVEDAKEIGLVQDAGAWAYLPMVVGDWGYPRLDQMSLVVRSAPGASVSAAAVRDVVGRLNPTVPLTSVRTLRESVARDMARTSFTMVLLGIAAAVALFLGAVGLFGVISYVVSRRTKEIGLRVAVGARGGDIGRMVLRQGSRVAMVGVAGGLVGAFALTRLMASVLYGVGATDPLTFVGGPVILVAVALLATWLPARRAARVDPVVALRSE